MEPRELELLIQNKLVNAGWDVSFDEVTMNKYRSDFVLRYKGNICGYVEVMMYKEGNEYFLYKKLQQAFHMIKETNPPLFIVTDGYKYHVSINGGPFEVIHFVPSPNTYTYLFDDKGGDNDEQ